MIKAGSLTYAIFVMVVAAILCMLMTTFAFMNRSYFIHVNRSEVLRDNAYSGIDFGKALPMDQDYDSWQDLYGEGHDSVRIKRRRWGSYFVISAQSKFKGDAYFKSAIIGYENQKFRKAALWLTDHNRPLQLAGAALLKGECYIPERGVSPTNVEGSNYRRKQMIYGRVKRSGTAILEPDDDMKEYWLNYLEGIYPRSDSVVNFEGLPREVEHSFGKRTLVATAASSIRIDHQKLKGNIVICSSTQILVGKQAILEEVVLVAPKIKLESGAGGRAHLVVSDTLIIGEGSKFLYPCSALVISGNQRFPYCLIDKNAQLNGSVFCFTDDAQQSNKLNLEIRQNALVRGLVYCEGNFELRGTVEGSVICNRFLLATPSGIYENYILNGQIDRTALPETFATAAFPTDEYKAKTISWIGY